MLTYFDKLSYFLFMTIGASTLFPFMSFDFVTLTFFSAGHQSSMLH